MLGVLKPLAEFLVRQPIDGNSNAGPTFEFYEFAVNSEYSIAQQIKDLYNQTLALWNDDGEAIQRLFNLQTVIGNLNTDISDRQPKPSFDIAKEVNNTIFASRLVDAFTLDELLKTGSTQ